jgi:hypothetical protein
MAIEAMNALPPVRRIVTGHDADGRSVVVLQGAPPSFALQAVPGTVFHEIWRTAGIPMLTREEPDPALGPLQLAPPPAGSRIRVVDIPPDSVQNAISADQAAAAFAEIGAAHAGTGAEDGTRHRLMHKTETVDYGILVAGELWLVLDESEVRLRVGDVVVQRGTNHAWSNRTETMARMVFILLDASPAEGAAVKG